MPESIQKQSLFILQTYEEIKKANAVSACISILKAICDVFGYEYYCVANLPGPSENSLQTKMLMSNWPAQLILQYDDFGLLKSCPIIKEIWTSGADVQWDLSTIVLKRSALEGPKTADLFKKYGMQKGTAFPGSSLSGKRGLVMFSGHRDHPKEGELAALHLLSHFLFAKISIVSSTKRKKAGRLSRREWECVELVAHGKTTEEIAIVLGLSASTVAGYLTTAATKLEASNRSHLVAQAFRRGLLEA